MSVPIELAIEAARVMADAKRAHPEALRYVYAIQAGETGPVKIGVTNNPATRLVTLQQGNHETLRGIAAWWTFPFEEKQLHEEFAYARIRGEWFRPVPELIEMVLALGGEFEDWVE